MGADEFAACCSGVLWCPRPDFFGPVEPRTVRVLPDEGVATLKAMQQWDRKARRGDIVPVRSSAEWRSSPPARRGAILARRRSSSQTTNDSSYDCYRSAVKSPYRSRKW
jgi:hypothetical protein